MYRIIALAAVAAVALATPALAKTKKHHHAYQGSYAQPYAAPYPGPWVSRNVSDPSLGHPSAADLSRASSRCIADLGYGRYEACGW